jgi:hypothetical protein
MSAKESGMGSYAIPAFCVHNTNQLLRLPKEFYDCYHYVKKKWKRFLPIYTSCMKISPLNEELHLKMMREVGERLLGRRRSPIPRLDDPRMALRDEDWSRGAANRLVS